MERRALFLLLPILLLCGACGAAAGSGGPPALAGVDTTASLDGERDGSVGDHVETDNELPFRESLGEDGIDGAPFTGPANNGLIGLEDGRSLRIPEASLPPVLTWLALQQDDDGSWRPYEGAHRDAAVDLTGRALAAFLARGYTNRGRHPFARVVARGLRALKNVQDAEGFFASPGAAHRLQTHAWALFAMLDAYRQTESPIFRASARCGLDALVATCAEDPLDLDHYETQHAVLACLFCAASADACRRSRGRDPVFDLELRGLFRLAWLRDPPSSGDAIDRAVSAIACLVFDDPTDDARRQDVRRLVEESLEESPVWNATWDREGPSVWRLQTDALRFAADAGDFGQAPAWRASVRGMLERWQVREGETLVEERRLRWAEDGEDGAPAASWDPDTLAGYRFGRQRLAADLALVLGETMRPGCCYVSVR